MEDPLQAPDFWKQSHQQAGHMKLQLRLALLFLPESGSAALLLVGDFTSFWPWWGSQIWCNTICGKANAIQHPMTTNIWSWFHIIPDRLYFHGTSNTVLPIQKPYLTLSSLSIDIYSGWCMSGFPTPIGCLKQPFLQGASISTTSTARHEPSHRTWTSDQAEHRPKGFSGLLGPCSAISEKGFMTITSSNSKPPGKGLSSCLLLETCRRLSEQSFDYFAIHICFCNVYTWKASNSCGNPAGV